MNSKLKSGIFASILALASAVTGHAAWTYVGSWDLSNLSGNYGNPANPYLWTNNPTVYSGVEAAAHLFGGSASQYAISTVGSSVSDINHLAFVDGWGDEQYLQNPASENFSVDLGVAGYNDIQTFGAAYSALVTDHGPSHQVGSFVNYAFRWSDPVGVPDSASTLGLLGVTVVGLAVLRRRAKSA